MLDHTSARIHQNGFVANDFAELATNLLLVEPIYPPEQSLGGIVTGQAWQTLPGNRMLMFRVVAHGEQSGCDEWPAESFSVGDVLVIRNAMAEPVHPNLEFLVVNMRHVLAVVSQ
jgi:co-chaperonin GroES (HSP10)